jgi:hypothetical protein
MEGQQASRLSNGFYSILKLTTAGITDKLTFVRNVLNPSDAPEFGVSD